MPVETRPERAWNPANGDGDIGVAQAVINARDQR
jgi:hypothetical protein